MSFRKYTYEEYEQACLSLLDMNFRKYTDEEYEHACRSLLEIRDNCIRDYANSGLSDKDSMKKAEAINTALKSVGFIGE